MPERAERKEGFKRHSAARQHTSAYVSIRRMSGCTPMTEKCLEELKEKEVSSNSYKSVARV
jgi:hypothetical protein